MVFPWFPWFLHVQNPNKQSNPSNPSNPSTHINWHNGFPMVSMVSPCAIHGFHGRFSMVSLRKNKAAPAPTGRLWIPFVNHKCLRQTSTPLRQRFVVPIVNLISIIMMFHGALCFFCSMFYETLWMYHDLASFTITYPVGPTITNPLPVTSSNFVADTATTPSWRSHTCSAARVTPTHKRTCPRRRERWPERRSQLATWRSVSSVSCTFFITTDITTCFQAVSACVCLCVEVLKNGEK